MNNIKYTVYRILGFRKLLRKYYKFMETDYAFFETEDENLIIPESLRWVIAYTNNKKVIVFGDDIMENRFTTIIYEIHLSHIDKSSNFFLR
jgi:hypothetical protein